MTLEAKVITEEQARNFGIRIFSEIPVDASAMLFSEERARFVDPAMIAQAEKYGQFYGLIEEHCDDSRGEDVIHTFRVNSFMYGPFRNKKGARGYEKSLTSQKGSIDQEGNRIQYWVWDMMIPLKHIFLVGESYQRDKDKELLIGEGALEFARHLFFYFGGDAKNNRGIMFEQIKVEEAKFKGYRIL